METILELEEKQEKLQHEQEQLDHEIKSAVSRRKIVGEQLLELQNRIEESKLGFMSQSRWGYHPCSYTHFRKLKFLNRMLFKARKQYASWYRWKRKAEHNRVQKRYLRNENNLKVGVEILGPLKEPQRCTVFTQTKWNHEKDKSCLVDVGIVKDFQNARIPTSKEEVLPLILSLREVDELLESFDGYPEYEEFKKFLNK